MYNIHTANNSLLSQTIEWSLLVAFDIFHVWYRVAIYYTSRCKKKNPHQEHRKDFWSGPALIGAHVWHTACNGVCMQISIMNLIKSPKKWSGQNRTSQTGSYAYAHNHDVGLIANFISGSRKATKKSGRESLGPIYPNTSVCFHNITCIHLHPVNVSTHSIC